MDAMETYLIALAEQIETDDVLPAGVASFVRTFAASDSDSRDVKRAMEELSDVELAATLGFTSAVRIEADKTAKVNAATLFEHLEGALLDAAAERGLRW